MDLTNTVCTLQVPPCCMSVRCVAFTYGFSMSARRIAILECCRGMASRLRATKYKSRRLNNRSNPINNLNGCRRVFRFRKLGCEGACDHNAAAVPLSIYVRYTLLRNGGLGGYPKFIENRRRQSIPANLHNKRCYYIGCLKYRGTCNVGILPV